MTKPKKPTPPIEPAYLRRRTCAEFWDTSTDYVDKRIRTGQIPFHKDAGGNVWIARTDAVAFMESIRIDGGEAVVQ